MDHFLIKLTRRDTNSALVINVLEILTLEDGEVVLKNGSKFQILEGLEKLRKILSIAGVSIID